MNKNQDNQETFKGETVIETVNMNNKDDINEENGAVGGSVETGKTKITRKGKGNKNVVTEPKTEEEEYSVDSESEEIVSKIKKEVKKRVSKKEGEQIVEEFKKPITSLTNFNFTKVLEYIKSSNFITNDFRVMVEETERIVSNKKFFVDDIKSLMGKLEIYYKLNTAIVSYYYQQPKYNHDVSYLALVLKGSAIKNRELFTKYTSHIPFDRKANNFNFDFDFVDEETNISIFNLEKNISCQKLKEVLVEAEKIFQSIYYTTLLFLILSMYLYTTNYVEEEDVKSPIMTLRKKISVLFTDANKKTKEIICVLKKEGTTTSKVVKNVMNDEDKETVKNTNLKKGTTVKGKNVKKQKEELPEIDNKAESEDDDDVIHEN